MSSIKELVELGTDMGLVTSYVSLFLLGKRCNEMNDKSNDRSCHCKNKEQTDPVILPGIVGLFPDLLYQDDLTSYFTRFERLAALLNIPRTPMPFDWVVFSLVS
ncbi:hypothetical protein E2C01_042473 [Portunus trituberculatus]|uniref:Uncharacterized protein n=1 Tax=Portunus trituberculatus TaxID=210409 RepID=A0A5B7FMI0_PORTR|nr:hypothetical protein [Portunus trituberculatus]